jgi:hypothetical protein
MRTMSTRRKIVEEIERDGVYLQATPVDLLDGVVLAEDSTKTCL